MNLYFYLFVGAIVLLALLIGEGIKIKTANPVPNDKFNTVILDNSKEYVVQEITFLPRGMVKIKTSDNDVILTSTNKCILMNKSNKAE